MLDFNFEIGCLTSKFVMLRCTRDFGDILARDTRRNDTALPDCPRPLDDDDSAVAASQNKSCRRTRHLHHPNTVKTKRVAAASFCNDATLVSSTRHPLCMLCLSARTFHSLQRLFLSSICCISAFRNFFSPTSPLTFLCFASPSCWGDRVSNPFFSSNWHQWCTWNLQYSLHARQLVMLDSLCSNPELVHFRYLRRSAP